MSLIPLRKSWKHCTRGLKKGNPYSPSTVFAYAGRSASFIKALEATLKKSVDKAHPRHASDLQLLIFHLLTCLLRSQLPPSLLLKKISCDLFFFICKFVPFSLLMTN